jgi:hypothetical protein
MQRAQSTRCTTTAEVSLGNHSNDSDEDGRIDSSDALTSKVDALVSKHNVVADERNIPLLTDLVDAPDWRPSEGNTANAAAEPDVLSSLSDADIDALSQEIFARVSKRIDSELATSLEARLNEHLQSQISSAVTHVLTDMKLSIANEIGDAINAALADRLRQK